MIVKLCDLCRGEMSPPTSSIVLVLHTQPPKEFYIQDVCDKCMEVTTTFLDGLRNGPPGASLMLPKEGDANDGTAA